MPDVDFPVVNVSLSLQGAAPEVMETQVVDPVEDAIMGIQGIVSVTSTARQGSANVTVEFDLDRNIDAAVQEVQSRVAQVQKILPSDVDPPTIRKTNPEDQPIIWLTLSSDGSVSMAEQMMYARNVLLDQFSTVDGVGDVGLGGYVDPNLRVWLSDKNLRKFNVTAADVVQTIENEQAEIPMGRLSNDKREWNVRLVGEANTVEDFGKIFVNSRVGAPNYKPIRLHEIARIEDGLADIRRISRIDGRTAVGFGILKQHGSNAVEVAKNVRKKVDELKLTLPKAYSLDVRMDNTRFISDSVHELNLILVLSAILTSIVCFLFLGSWSSTINVLFAIPTSIMGAFIAIYFFGFTLNTFTLLGLSLAIGIVVDDAIMMLENIVRHSELGKKRRRASIDGSNEITFAALAATIAIVAIFLPVVFMKGIIGRFLFQYGITVTAAVLLSLIEALTLTPMRCSQFLKVGHHGRIALWMDRIMALAERAYAKVLVRILRFPKTTVGVALAIFALSLIIAKRIPSELVPAQDQSMLMVRLKAPMGSAIEYTDKKSKEVEELLHSFPEVKSVFSTIGGFGGDAVNQSMFFVSLVDPSQRKKSQQVFMNELRPVFKKKIHGAQLFIQDMSLRGFTSSRGFPVEFTVHGGDWDKLGNLTNELIEKVKATGLVADINTDFSNDTREIHLIPDRAKAALYGVNLADISRTVNVLVGGAITGDVRYPKAGHRYDIRVRLEKFDRIEADDIAKVQVRNNYGELIPLSNLVHIEEQPASQIITRRNRERAITVNANMAPGHAQSEVLSAISKLSATELPVGYHVELTGSAQTFKESFQSLLFAMFLGIIVSYMVLASQFDSFIHPISVLMALPFSISGALWALWLGGQSLNMFSVIGLILLLGIVKKNSILLVDFTNQLRREGMPLVEALTKAGPVRLRPIIMTSLATVAGAIPEAIGVGPGAETRVPMAIGIIGGVLVSTVLTLYVVPCVYLLLSRFERRPLIDPNVIEFKTSTQGSI